MNRSTRGAALVSNRAFLALWLGQLISNLGDNLLHVNAIGFALGAHRGAGSSMAMILIVSTLPALVLGSLAGVLADRGHRKRIMIGSDLARCVLIATLPLVATQGFAAVCLVMALAAAVACFFGPARTALIPSAVAPAQLVAANAWFSTSGFLIALVGTAAGGWLLAHAGLSVALWVNAAVYGLSALAISLAKIRAGRPARTAPLRVAGAIQDLRKGWGLIRRHQAVRDLIGHYVALMALAAAIYIGIIGWAGQEASGGLQRVALLLTSIIGGLLVGGLLAHRLSRRLGGRTLCRLALGALGAGAAGIALDHAARLTLGWLALIGAGGALYAAVVEASLQRIVPDRVRGRVIATRSILSGVAVSLTSALAGWLIDGLGKTVLFGLVAVSCLMAIVLLRARAFSRRHATGPGALYWATRWVLRQLGFAYFRLEINGLAHLPTRGPAIVAGNHPSVLDGILLLIASPRPVRFLVAEEFFFHPSLHWLFNGMGCIPVYRTRSNNGDALHAAVEALRRGEVIGIFPEGTTLDGGRLRIVRRGVGLLALRTGAPVVPFGICGSGAAFPEGARIPRPGRINLTVAPAVTYVRSTAHPVPAELLQRVLDDVRWEILRAIRWAEAAQEATTRVWQGKPIQVALASLVILPLSGFLSLTSNPSLDPVGQRGSSA